MNADVQGWAILFFRCLVIPGALLVVHWISIRWGREKAADDEEIRRYLQLLGATIERVHQWNVRQTEQDAEPATGRPVFGRLATLRERRKP